MCLCCLCCRGTQTGMMSQFDACYAAVQRVVRRYQFDRPSEIARTTFYALSYYVDTAADVRLIGRSLTHSVHVLSAVCNEMTVYHLVQLTVSFQWKHSFIHRIYYDIRQNYSISACLFVCVLCFLICVDSFFSFSFFLLFLYGPCCRK